MAEKVVVSCLFCSSKFVEEALESHMNDDHRMVPMLFPISRVKCMFYWGEEVEEDGMEGNIRDVHKISGLKFASEPTERTSWIMQTDEQMEQQMEDYKRKKV